MIHFPTYHNLYGQLLEDYQACLAGMQPPGDIQPPEPPVPDIPVPYNPPPIDIPDVPETPDDIYIPDPEERDNPFDYKPDEPNDEPETPQDTPETPAGNKMGLNINPVYILAGIAILFLILPKNK